jgi:[ribosomal protein S18]-alanine N-acetyltransferase
VREDVSIESAAALDADDCRRLVLASEPWITLGYDDTDVQAIVRSAATEHLLLARVDGRVVGFALSAPGVLLGEYLKILVVEADHHANGIGRRLMDELERRAFQRWPNVYLCVSDFNHGARRFYRRLGYEEVGALRDLLIGGTGEILMRKTIAAWRSFARPPA